MYRSNMCVTLFRRLFTWRFGDLACAVLVILQVLLASASDGSVASHTLDKNTDGQSSQPEGHLQPLGAHRRPEGSVHAVDGFLEPKEFYTNHVLASKPVLFKGAAHDLPAFQLWSDTYLKENYGSIPVDVEPGKKEDRDGQLRRMSFGKFLDIYNESDIYMVQDIMPEMTDDLILPLPLQCGGFQDVLSVGVIWFSSGGTKSVLHSDDVDNINCILDGSKDLVFIDKEFQSVIEDEHFDKDKSYSKVDVEKVDLYKFPHYSDLRWWEAKMEKGDCLFIPVRWYHSVASSDSRNLAVNLWFSHLAWFNKTDCENCCHENPSLSKYPIGESMEQIRHDIFSKFENLEYVRLEDAVKMWKDELKHPALVQEVFELIDQDKDLILSWDEIFSIDVDPLVRDFPELVGEDPENELPHDEL